jgi:hypothetical protein
MEYESVTQIVLVAIDCSLYRVSKKLLSHTFIFHKQFCFCFLISCLKSTCHRNPNDNFESICKSMSIILDQFFLIALFYCVVFMRSGAGHVSLCLMALCLLEAK